MLNTKFFLFSIHTTTNSACSFSLNFLLACVIEIFFLCNGLREEAQIEQESCTLSHYSASLSFNTPASCSKVFISSADA